MAYKLLIEMDLGFESPFKSLLKPGELIRGEPAKLTFFVTNLGRTVFPGGTVRNWCIDFGAAHDVEHTSATANVKCSSISPGEKIRLLSENIVPLVEGLAWVNFSIEPKGEKKEEIQYYQSHKERVGGKEWTYCFYVVDRQMVQLTTLINELIRKIETLRG